MEPYQRLEAELARWADVPEPNMVVCNSGTAALHLALEALRLPPGSEVLVPEFTFVACARAVVLAGLTPVFVDCGNDLLVDFDSFSEALGGPIVTWPKVVMAVHVYGRQEDIGWMRGFGSFRIVEDLAEAHGVRPHPQTDAACWSFYRNKIVAGEEGGAVYLRYPEHAALARSLRSQGYGGGGDWQHKPRGMNYRMTNAQASLVLTGLARWGSDWPQLADRRVIEGWYDAECPAEWRMPPRDVPWVYDLRVPHMDAGLQSVLVKELQHVGIAARCGFKPMSSQEEFKTCRRVGDATVATRMSREVIALPIQPGVTTRESARRAFEVIVRTVG